MLAISAPQSLRLLRVHWQSSVKRRCPILAQFKPGADQDAVDVDAGLPLKFEEQVNAPVSLAPRLRTQPPQPRIAPVRL